MINILEQREDRAFKLFTRSIENEQTKQDYIKVLKRFQEFCKCSTFSELKGYTEREAKEKIIDFLISLSDKGLSKSYINRCFSGIERFYKVNDLVLKI